MITTEVFDELFESDEVLNLSEAGFDADEQEDITVMPTGLGSGTFQVLVGGQKNERFEGSERDTNFIMVLAKNEDGNIFKTRVVAQRWLNETHAAKGSRVKVKTEMRKDVVAKYVNGKRTDETEKKDREHYKLA